MLVGNHIYFMFKLKNLNKNSIFDLQFAKFTSHFKKTYNKLKKKRKK